MKNKEKKELELARKSPETNFSSQRINLLTSQQSGPVWQISLVRSLIHQSVWDPARYAL